MPSGSFLGLGGLGLATWVLYVVQVLGRQILEALTTAYGNSA